MSLPRYESYMDWGNPLASIPSHWSVSRLHHLASINDDTLPEDCDPAHEVEYVDISSVTLDRGIHQTQQFAFSSAPSRARRLVRGGDIIVSTVRTYLKAIAPIRQGQDHLVVSTGFAVVRPKAILASGFAKYALQSPTFVDDVISRSTGVSYPAINASDLARIDVPTPPPEEQVAIAAFLDRETAKIDALIAEQGRLLELLAEKRQAVISHAVTKGLNPDAPMKESGVAWLGAVPAHWDVKAIKWLSPVLRGASPRPIDDAKYFDDEGEFAWVRIADSSASDGILQETTQRLSELGSSLSVKIYPGQLFVSIAGTVGKPCIAGIKCCIHDGFVYFPRLPIRADFLFRIFEDGACYAGLGKMGTQLNLNTDTIGSIRIAVPPSDEIDTILAFIDERCREVDALRRGVQRAIALLAERRSALIAAAVTGQIDVREAA